MPNVRWEWKVGPQVLISFANLCVMLIGLVYVFASMEADVRVAKDQVSDVRTAVTALQATEQQQAIDGASVKAKVDLILPMVEKLNDVAAAQFPARR